jgi:glycosyltransferase involved in cell wall biosynthesis
VRCLEALARQDHPPDRFEVIVVDDDSTVEMRPLIDRYDDRLNLKLLRQPRSGPSAARNRAANVARGSLLAFTDDDAAPDRGWLGAFARRHAAEADSGLGGRTVADQPGNRYALVGQRVVELAYAHYNADPIVSRFFASNNLALPADGFRALGGFDATLRVSEDRELCDRWVERGWRLRFVAEALITHSFPATLRQFVAAHFAYGAGAYGYQRARRRRGLGLSGIDRSFYEGLLRREVPAALRERDLQRLGMLGLWQATYTAGFAWGAIGAAARACSRVSSKPPVEASTR